jgi:hypothetical protein
MNAETLEAGLDLAEAAAAYFESLKHPKHADVLKPIRAKAEHVLQRFFRKQRRALMKSIDHHLRILGGHRLHEADKPEDGLTPEDIAAGIDLAAKTRMRNLRAQTLDIIGTAIPAGTMLPIPMSAAMDSDYSGALKSAIGSGFEHLAAEFGSKVPIEKDVLYQYLKDRSLTKLTGNINATTVKQLRDALADTYESGGDYEALKQTVLDTYDRFGSVRAGMIAQTEMNGAYNAGRMVMGASIGATEKSWNPDGTMVCIICLANVAQGWIPFEDDFLSGDQMPPAHPNCVLPDTKLIPAGRILRAYRRRYMGSVCNITGEGGEDMNVTPNHPILTRRGWVAAGLLERGDQIAKSGGKAGTAAKEIFDSLVKQGGIYAAGVPVVGEAFHGDVSSDYRADIVDAGLESAAAAADRVPVKFRFGHCVWGTLATDKELAALLDGGEAAGAIQFVKVVGIKFRKYAGFVYNLETELGFYSADSVIVHNCDCSVDYRVGV